MNGRLDLPAFVQLERSGALPLADLRPGSFLILRGHGVSFQKASIRPSSIRLSRRAVLTAKRWFWKWMPAMCQHFAILADCQQSSGNLLAQQFAGI
jgi:hypothetical protein